MVKLEFVQKLTLGQISENIQDSGINHSDIIAFIKQLDIGMEDWDATEKLYVYFAKQHEEYIKEKEEVN